MPARWLPAHRHGTAVVQELLTQHHHMPIEPCPRDLHALPVAEARLHRAPRHGGAVRREKKRPAARVAAHQCLLRHDGGILQALQHDAQPGEESRLQTQLRIGDADLHPGLARVLAKHRRDAGDGAVECLARKRVGGQLGGLAGP